MHSPIAEMEETEPVKKVRGRPRKTVVKEEVGDDGAEAGIEDEPEKVAPVKVSLLYLHHHSRVFQPRTAVRVIRCAHTDE